MSNSIDKRIVEMQFNNKQFESGIQTSIKSLDRLKQNLNLEKAAKGLESLEKAGRSFNLSSMNDSITAISNRFSAMGIVGMTVLQNITNSAYNCAKRMMNILAVDPLKMGFSEYETQINSVQTILANTSSEMDKLGYDQQQRLDIVNQKLDELNVYADKTIYNFSEMTRNIGTFTAAGVELDTSVSSIKGIANLAAVSGSTSQQASTAMYQLSQAIATGTIRLMDWNSVVNAGMGGEVFQNALIRTASNMKVVGEDAQKMFAKLQAGEVSFRDSLSSGWLSSDILTATLSQIAMDFEQIAKANGLLLENGAADIESAKKLMRSSLIAEGYTDDEADEIINLAETATDAATKVKTLTQLFDTLKEAMQSGWTQSWEYIIGDFNEAKELLTSVSDYFGAIIGASADSRNAMLADWAELGGRNALIDSFWNIIYSIKNVTGTIRKAFEEFFPQTTGQQLFDITKKISDFTEKIKVATENSELMGRVSRVFRGVAAALDIVRTAAGWAWDGFKRLLEQTNGAAGGFLDFLAGIGDSVLGFRDAIKSSEALQGILNGLGNTAAAVYDMVAGGIKRIGTFFENLWTQIQGSGIFTRIGDFLTEVLGKIPEFIARIGEWGNSIINWVKSCETLKNAWNSVKGFFGPIISGIADFGKALWDGIQAFFGEDTNGEGFLDKIKVRFSAFGEKIGEWFETIGPKLKQDWENVRAFMTALFTKTIPQFFANLKMEAIQKWPWLERNLMVRAVRKIGSLNSKTILKGVLGVAGIAAAFSVLVNSAKGVNFGSSIGALLLMAGSIILFIETFKQVEGANADSMVKFAVSLAMMMLSISVAMKIMSTIPITGALASVANFAIFIVGVGGIITALGWIQSEWSGMTSFLEEGGNVLGQIGTAIGKFAGGIAGGFMQGMNLPQIGTDLTDFMTNVQGFIDGAANIKSESLTGAQTLVGVIGSIAGTEFKNWLVNLFLGENPITKFSGDIVSLGKALTSYALAVLPMTLVPQTVIDRSVSVATALASVAKQIPATGGILSVINGIGDMSTFSTNIKSLGSGLTDFGIEISKIDDSKFNQTKIDAVIAVANGLAALEEGLEGQGGLEDKIEGVKSLSKFSEGIEPFGLGINKFITEANKIIFDPKTDQEKIEAVIAIGNALRVLETGLEGQGGLEDKIEGIKSLSKFSEGMEPFAEGLNSFISQVRLIDYDPDIDGARLYAVMDIGKALADLENSVQAQGGWVDAILGIKSLSAFGGEMPDFATGLNNFITQVSALEDDKYDADKIEKVLAVAAAINELNHALPATDGFIQGILGTQDLGLFSENIKKVGEALSSFSTNVAGSTINKAESAVSALEVIRTFTSTLKQEGGLWNDIGKFFGGSQENTLLGYAANMRKIGEDLNIFSTNIEDVKIDNIGKASGVVEAIGEFIETLSVSGGVFEVLGSFFKGNKAATLEAMSTQMGNFGTEIGKLATGISNIETTQTNFNGAKILFDSFRTFYSAVEEVGEISYTGNMNDLLWTLDDFGVSLAAFSTNLGTTDISTLSSATAIIETLTTLASSAAGINPDNVGTIGAILEEFGKLNMSSFVTAFAESSGEAVLAVTGLISQIRTTIQNDTTVGAACATLSQRGVTALRLTWIDWFTAGSYLGRGMGSGITSATGFIRTAAVNAARSAISAVRVTWDEHSPSKVGAELGQFWDMGLAGGIDRYGYLIGQSAADVSSDAIRSAQSVLNDMSHIGSDIDSNFTIRPVMDLTDILNGMNDIDGLFSGERTIASGYFNGLTGIRSARAFASEQGRITAMTDNGDIVNELVMLEKKLDELSESVRNMKIVLDTGVVVGEITEGVDENLGVLAGRRERGN